MRDDGHVAQKAAMDGRPPSLASAAATPEVLFAATTPTTPRKRGVDQVLIGDFGRSWSTHVIR
jgi:hypothetical protein